MKNDDKLLKIPRSITLQFSAFFGFFFFNSVLVAMRSVLVAIAFLAVYYSCIGIQKALLTI